jgi:hypothetical protein
MAVASAVPVTPIDEPSVAPPLEVETPTPSPWTDPAVPPVTGRSCADATGAVASTASAADVNAALLKLVMVLSFCAAARRQ